MYKLFLCLRYLRSKVFAYFAVLGVALCVWMMLVSVSVMTGFLNKIELAAKGLFGDIIIEGRGERGLAWYDEFIAKMKREVPEVEAAGPFILGLGILRVENDRNFRQHVQIAGIRLPGRAEMTDFETGLFVQAGNPAPTFDPPIAQAIAAIKKHRLEMRKIVQREFAKELAKLPEARQTATIENLQMLRLTLGDKSLTPKQRDLLYRIDNAVWLQNQALRHLELAQKKQGQMSRLREQLRSAQAGAKTEADKQIAADKIAALQLQIDDLVDLTRLEPPADRVILGLGIPGLSFRTDIGETVRYLVPGHRVILQVAPLGKALQMTGVSLNSRKFTVIDDSRTDVSSIDSKLVYVPFETLQQLNNMQAEFDADDPSIMLAPACCNQIHIKVKGQPSEGDLRKIAGKIQGLWQEFARGYADKPTLLAPAIGDVSVDTWRQRQMAVVGPIEQQRTLVVIIMAIMSIVAVALVFVILYTIVVQKTREIGVLKALGASGWGVAGLFFAYGAAIGLLGAVIGILAGYYTTKNINSIQDWADSMFGLRVWTRKSFMFECIPNEVDWNMACFIVAGAIAAGLVGALIPAIRAARMEPVEALRYE